MSGNDDGFAIVNLDFEFPFFGELYNSLTITTNGAITFNDTFEDVKTLADVYNTKTIASCVADYKVMRSDGVYYYSTPNYAVLKWIVSYRVTGPFGYVANIEFATKLYPDGKIEFFYGTFTHPIPKITCISNGS